MIQIPNIAEIVALEKKHHEASQAAYAALETALDHPAVQALIPEAYTSVVDREQFIQSLFLPTHNAYSLNVGADLVGDAKLARLRTQIATASEFTEIREKLVAAYDAKSRAYDTYDHAKKLYASHYPHHDINGLMDQHRDALKKAGTAAEANAQHALPAPSTQPTTMHKATQPTLPTRVVAPSRQPPPAHERPSLDHPRHAPILPPKEPSWLESFLNRFKRTKPSKSGHHEEVLDALRSAATGSHETPPLDFGPIVPAATETASHGHGGKIALGLGVAAAGGWALYEVLRQNEKKTAPQFPKR